MQSVEGAPAAEAPQSGGDAVPWAEVFAATPLAVAINDAAAERILFASEAYARLHGYEVHELIGRPVASMYPPEAQAEIAAAVADATTARALTFRAEHLRRDGSTFPARVDARAMTGADGQVRCWVVTVEDLTESEGEAEARARLAAIVESSEDAVIGKSLDGVVTTWNAAAERLFGWTAAEAVGRPILFIIPPELRGGEPGLLERLARGERVAPYETVRIHRDGTRLPVSLAVSPGRDASGAVIGAAKIVRDVTSQGRRRRRTTSSPPPARASPSRWTWT